MWEEQMSHCWSLLSSGSQEADRSLGDTRAPWTRAGKGFEVALIPALPAGWEALGSL